MAGATQQDGGVPKLLKVDGQGQLYTVAGALLGAAPPHDEIQLDYYGSTNNLQTVVYRLENETVATWTLTYAGGGAADNDILSGVTKDT